MTAFVYLRPQSRVRLPAAVAALGFSQVSGGQIRAGISSATEP